jgi:hypothetical protein
MKLLLDANISWKLTGPLFVPLPVPGSVSSPITGFL